MTKGCQICPILASRDDGNDAQVYQSQFWRVVLDRDQRTLGKSFITLLEHKQSISELSQPEWVDLRDVISKLEASTTRAFQPSHFNWSCLMNNAVVANQPTHVHWHMHPRYTVPVVFADETFEDTELFDPKRRTAHIVSSDVAAQIARTMAP